MSWLIYPLVKNTSHKFSKWLSGKELVWTFGIDMEMKPESSNPHSAHYYYSSVLAPNNENYTHKAWYQYEIFIK